MRRVLLVLLAVCQIAGFAAAVYQMQETQRDEFLNAARAQAVAFRIPNGIDDPDVVFSALAQASRKADANVARTVLINDEAGVSTITQYVLLNTADAAVLRPVIVTSGRLLSVAETRNATDANAVTIGTMHSARQVGRIRSMSPSVRVLYAPLHGAFSQVPAAGLYFAQCPDGRCSAFLASLASLLNAATPGAGVSANTLANAGAGSLSDTSTSSRASMFRYVMAAAVLLTAVFAIYVQFAGSKKSGILKLHGFATMRIWHATCGRSLIRLWLVLLAACTLIALLGWWSYPAVAGKVLAIEFVGGALVIAASLLPVGYIMTLNVAGAIRNRRDTRGIFWIGTAISVAVTAGALVASAGAFEVIRLIDQQQSALKPWQSTSRYGVFSPVSNGNNTLDLQTNTDTTTAREAGALYEQLERQGALYIDASNFTPQALAQSQAPGSYRMLSVNPAYLARYPIAGSNGKPVALDKNTADWIVLAPSRYRSQERALRDFLSQSRQDAFRSQQAVLGIAPPSKLAHQRIRIVWVSDGQQAFSFDPDVYPSRNGMIPSPLIQVVTTVNSMPIDRINAVTGDAGGGLKMPLRDGDGARTLRGLQPLLHA